jgi:hypothetical protein
MDRSLLSRGISIVLLAVGPIILKFPCCTGPPDDHIATLQRDVIF